MLKNSQDVKDQEKEAKKSRKTSLRKGRTIMIHTDVLLNNQTSKIVKLFTINDVGYTQTHSVKELTIERASTVTNANGPDFTTLKC